MDTIIKYELLHSVNGQMEVIDIFDSLDAAGKAMQDEMTAVMNSPKKLDTGISLMDAHINPVPTTEKSHHWKIIPLACAHSECHVANMDDYNVVVGVYKTYCSSGAVFLSSCLINLQTRQVFNIEDAGILSDNDDVTSEAVAYVYKGREEEYSVVNLHEVLEEKCETALGVLEGIKLLKQLWYYNDGSLDSAIEKCRNAMCKK